MGLFGGSASASTTNTNRDYNETGLTQAAGWQVPYQQEALAGASQIYNNGPYSGPYATGSNPLIDRGIDDLSNVYGNVFPDVANQYDQQANMLTPGQGTAYDYYNNVINNGYNTQYDPIGMLDPNVMNSAINNPIINEQIAAGTSDIQNFYDQNIAQVKANAVAGGGGASSWRGLMQSDALQGAGRDIANLSSGLRGQAYGYGVDAANRANQFTNQANQRDWLGGQNAADNLFNYGSQGMDYRQMAAQIMEAGGRGLVETGGIQRGIEEDLRFGEERRFNAPMDVLRDYYSIVGKNLGQQSDTSGEENTKSTTLRAKASYGI